MNYPYLRIKSVNEKKAKEFLEAIIKLEFTPHNFNIRVNNIFIESQMRLGIPEPEYFSKLLRENQAEEEGLYQQIIDYINFDDFKLNKESVERVEYILELTRATKKFLK